MADDDQKEPRNPEVLAAQAAWGDVLRKKRQALGLKQREVAAMARCGQNGVSRAENGVSLGHQLKIAEAFGLPFSEVVAAAERAAEAKAAAAAADRAA